MINSAPFYWVECDGKGCTATHPESGSECVAWQDVAAAEEDALDSDWQLTEGRLWLCFDCQIAQTNAEADSDSA